MIHQLRNNILLFALVLLTVQCGSMAKTVKPETKAKKEKTIESETKSSKVFEGLFTVYQDTTNGSLLMEISEDQLNKEYIYFTYVENGTVMAGRFRGQFRENTVITFRKSFDRIEVVKLNTNFYFDPENAISRASEANVTEAILASEKIEVHDKKTGRYLIKADPLFLTESLHLVSPVRYPGQSPFAFNVGKLSKDKTKYNAINNYPENTDLVVDYVFENSSPVNGGGIDVTDARSVTITLQHSLIAMPENDFKPRFDDPRVGYFMVETEDMTSASYTPYRDMINRWNLVKKNPDAKLSEPVEPITWWIENTTPVEFRAAIEEGVLAWNKAYEAAGFKDAMVVKVQPYDADWTAGDIRYNVLRWTSSPYPPFGGYGPSFVNPRTGQIIGADIMLEYVFFTNRVKLEELWDAENALSDRMEYDPHLCSASLNTYNNLKLGRAALISRGATEEELGEFIHASLVELTLHEVGHTLGLNHNMKASNLHSPDAINNRALTSSVGLTGSVMDYNAVNIARTRKEQGEYYQRIPGPYDIWAIQFGYDPDMVGGKRDALLARSTEQGLLFGNDADDMRAPGKAIDPRVMIGDLTSDPVEYGRIRMDVVKDLMVTLKDNYVKQGQSHQELYSAFMTLMGNHRTQAGIMTRHIGGVYVDRAFAGQPGAGQPYTPVPLEMQKKAMNYLTVYVFAPDAFDVPDQTFNYLQRQRRGFNFFSSSEDPKIHDMALATHRYTLAHLLHPNTTQRIIDSKLYGNQYDLADMMSDLTDAVFKAEGSGNVNTFRQNLQIEYVTSLANVISEDGKKSYDYITQSQALYQLQQVKSFLSKKKGLNGSTQAHVSHLNYILDEVLENK